MASFILNQPQPRAAIAATKLSRAGHDVIELAFHQLVRVDHEVARLAQLNLEQFDRIVFASPSSVAFSEPALRGRLAGRQVAAIGQGSATVLVETGLIANDADLIRPRQPPFDSAALVRLPQMSASEIRSILVVCGEQGRTDWIENYRQAGVEVTRVPIYRSQDLAPSKHLYQQLASLLARDESAVLVVGSVSEFTSLNQWLFECDDKNLTVWLQLQPVVVPHARIMRLLNGAGWSDVHPTMTGQTLLDAALELAGG